MEDTILTIGQAARLAGVSAKALRHYQRLGLIAAPERGPNGYRRYRPAELLRVRRIRRLQQLGLSLAQIGEVLGGPEGERSLPTVLAGLLAEVDAEIAALQERRAAILRMLDGAGPVSIDRPHTPSPTVRMLWEHVEPGLEVSPWLRETDEQLFDLLDTALGDNPAYRERMAELGRLIAAHPNDYRALLGLGQRLEALADADPNDPAVAELAADFRAAGATNPIIRAMSDLYLPADPTTTAALGDMMGAAASGALSPAQLRVLALAGATDQEDTDG